MECGMREGPDPSKHKVKVKLAPYCPAYCALYVANASRHLRSLWPKALGYHSYLCPISTVPYRTISYAQCSCPEVQCCPNHHVTRQSCWSGS